MKPRIMLLVVSCFILVPTICFAALLWAGRFIPVGTFNPAARQAMQATNNQLQEQRSAERAQPALASNNAQASTDAVNGTIGPLSDNPTYITGVNVAGTVRVNNLA